ncbi:MAG: hypothetical protein KDD58_15305, partial [Bdellovibrionales bacterium]|nr:hypothetical protein [Bdellovibrionales bacterium]
MKWLIIFISFFLIYCEKDNLKQDPLEGQPDRIRNGNPADLRKPDNRPACSRDSLVIEATPSVGVFEEGQLGKITFSGRVLDCGTKEYEIEILNKPNEADFNNGIFEYLPPETLVQG